MNKQLRYCLTLLLALCLALTACSASKSQDRDEDDDDRENEAAQVRDDSEDENDAPAVSDGYVFYENELFTSEIPADWELQRTKLQYFADTITEPQEGKSMWCSIVVSGAGIEAADVDALVADYRDTGFAFQDYEDTIAGQPARVIERGGGDLGLSQRDVYMATPDGTRFVMHFACPNGGAEFDFSEIEDVMEHFISHIEFK